MLPEGDINEPLLRVEDLEKRYERGSGLGSRAEIAALRGVSLSIFPQTTLALVGESGSGKSTLALCVACLEKPTSGKIWFGEREITALDESKLRGIRPRIQMVFQDPASSLNPRWSAAEIVSEPLLVQLRLEKQGRYERARELLENVGIPAEKAGQRPDEFSGGQRQRIAIARALALEPRMLVLDEALSALDCSVQAQIVNLLLDLQSSFGLTYLFITHDFAMAAHVADQVAVMDHGKIVETGTAASVVREPKHEITRRLIAAAAGSRMAPPAMKAS
jgi:ABC-type glutathione transport system ATPase component